MMSGHDEIEIAVTGSYWMGRGTGSIWSLVHDSFTKAVDEILITAYTISSETKEFFNLLDNTLARGVRITIIINRFSTQPNIVQRRILNLSRKHKHFILKRQ